MDIEQLASKLANLEWDTGYRFENGMPFCKRLSEQDVWYLLKALQHFGYTVVQDSPHVRSPSIVQAEHGLAEQTP
jgi:hypothetical protein